MQTRSRLILTVVGLLAALGVAGLLVLGNRPPDAAGSAASGTGVLSGREARAPAVAASMPDEPSSAPGARDLTESLVVAEPAQPGSGGAELVTVAIVRADSREPVPGAQVWQWGDSAFGSEGLAAWLPRGQVEDHLAEATALRADAQGRVAVPRGAQSFALLATSDELWGCAIFTGESTEAAVVALAPDSDVLVRVVDPEGAPVLGAPVALQQRRGPASFDQLVVRTEAPDGIARLRHAGHFLRAAAGESFVVALPGLLDPPLERPVSLADSADDVVSLVLEPTGSCEVVVLDAGGERLAGALEATLSFADTGPGGAASPLPQTATRRSRSGVDVSFEQVELGRQLAVSVQREGSAEPLLAAGAGPRRPGERVVLEVRVPGDRAILRGRLVDQAGVPLQVAVHARIDSASAEPVGPADWSLRTAPDGRFSVDCAPLPDEGVERSLAVYRLSEDGAELAVTRRPLPAALGSGTHDLGDFVLSQPPLVVAGVVVDDTGQPVADASITASPVDSASVDDGPALDRPLALAPVRSDASGRFEIFGELASAGTALVARKDSRIGGPVVARAGERGVRLVLGATGGLAGTVLLDPSLLDSLMLVQVARSDGAAQPGGDSSHKPALLDPDGHFSFRDLPPGDYRLAVVYAATGTELGAVDGLLVRAGEATHDARLEPLDLRAVGRLIELELVDERGEAVPGGRAFSRASGDPAASWCFASPVGGQLQLLSQGRPLDVALSAVGFLRTELEQVSASQRVVLRRAATLSLRLAPGLRLPEPPLQLCVELTPLEAGGLSGFVDSGRSAFDEQGMLTCHSEFTGELRVELVLMRRDRPASAPVYLREGVPRVITVADHPFEQPFEIRFDPARLEQAVEEVLAER